MIRTRFTRECRAFNRFLHFPRSTGGSGSGGGGSFGGGGGGFGGGGGGFGGGGGGFGGGGGGFGNNNGGGGGFGNNNGGGGGFGNNNGGGGGGGGSISLARVNISGGGGGGGGINGGGGANGGGGGGGLTYLTSRDATSQNATDAKDFFNTIGVNLSTGGRSVAFNDRLGLLFVKATPGELDTIERVIQVLNQVAPEIHIKARFIEIQQNDNAALGFDWYLGNFINGNVVANGGSAPSLNVPVSAANPLGSFPGNSTASQIASSATDQLLTGGLENTGPTLATITGIMTDPNFRVVIHALEQRNGVETLAEPEVTTISGRQTQMKATDLQNVVIELSIRTSRWRHRHGAGTAASAALAGVGGGVRRRWWWRRLLTVTIYPNRNKPKRTMRAKRINKTAAGLSTLCVIAALLFMSASARAQVVNSECGHGGDFAGNDAS